MLHECSDPERVAAIFAFVKQLDTEEVDSREATLVYLFLDWISTDNTEDVDRKDYPAVAAFLDEWTKNKKKKKKEGGVDKWYEGDAIDKQINGKIIHGSCAVVTL
jgi:hypothetical protein